MNLIPVDTVQTNMAVWDCFSAAESGPALPDHHILLHLVHVVKLLGCWLILKNGFPDDVIIQKMIKVSG